MISFIVPIDDLKAIVEGRDIEHDLKILVLCKDCKHRGAKTINEFDEYEVVFPDDVCPCQCDDYFYSWMPDDDWFCKNGERKEE